jgi:hypothetical protein
MDILFSLLFAGAGLFFVIAWLMGWTWITEYFYLGPRWQNFDRYEKWAAKIGKKKLLRYFGIIGFVFFLAGLATLIHW